MKNFLYLSVFCLLLTACGSCTTIDHLTVEGRRSGTLGLDEQSPRFGWQIQSKANDIRQQSYRIIVASTADKAKERTGDVWDSGVITSDCSQWIEYGGSPILPNQPFYWCVQVTTNQGETKWSDVATWSSGLLDDANWKGEWIGLDSLVTGEDSQMRHSRLRSRYMRQEFATDKDKRVQRATAHVSGLGYYAMFLNGERMPDNCLSPAPTDYAKSVIYNTYDVTDLIQRENCIGIILGGGYYYAMTQNYQTNVRTTYGFPCLLMNLIVEYSDGTVETISTDTTWKVNIDGPIRYSNLYDGMMYDARKELKGWLTPGYDDSAWLAAHSVKAPGGKLTGNLLPPVIVYETDEPLWIKQVGNRYIVDFGTNNTGRIVLKEMKLPMGDTLCIRYAELLDKGDTTLYTANMREAENTDYFIGNGEQREFTTEFLWHGFRYAEIIGIKGLKARNLVRENMADDLATDASITIHDADGNDMLNRIINNAYRGIMSNYKGIPMDCPQRDERMPWLGDRTTGCLGESYLTNNHAIYTKWVKDICECQRSDGRISDVAPAYWRLYNTNITWPAALPFSCDMLYRQYGDIRPMQRSYETIHRWLSHIRQKSYADGLLTYDRYGDWCVPPERLDMIHSEDSARITDGQLLASTYYYYLCRMMARYASLTGNDSLATYYLQEAETTQRAINNRFLTTDGRYDNATVTANLLPLAMGVVPDSMRQTAHKQLISAIVEKNNSHISCGVIGIQWLMRYLSESGHGDLAYRMASTDTYPSWGYMVKNGATTIWELWNGNTADPSMNSGNHVMLLGDLLPWCYEHLAGFRSDYTRNGFKHIVFAPDFSIQQISGVEAHYPSIHGSIQSNWHRQGESIMWDILIPANTTAEAHLPNGEVRQLTSGRHQLKF